jgi:hypothetical protein
MDVIEIFLRIAVMGFSLLLFVVLSIAYIKVRNIKLLFATIAFFLFFIKGILLTLGLFNVYFYKTFPTTSVLLLVDFLILVALYFGIAKK